MKAQAKTKKNGLSDVAAKERTVARNEKAVKHVVADGVLTYGK